MTEESIGTQESTGTHVDITRRSKLPIPREDPMMISAGDWARIRQNLGRLGQPLTEKASTWSATAVGALITCIVVLITFYTTDENEPGAVVAMFAVSAVFSALFALCFYLIGKSQEDQHRVSVASVCEDMDDVAERTGRPELRKPLPPPRARRKLLPTRRSQ